MNNKAKDYYAFKEITENPIILDFSNCKYIMEIHEVFKSKFGLPEYYGANPDALWDLLDGLFDNAKEISAEIYGLNSLREDLKDATLELISVLDDVSKETPAFSYKIVS